MKAGKHKEHSDSPQPRNSHEALSVESVLLEEFYDLEEEESRLAEEQEMLDQASPEGDKTVDIYSISQSDDLSSNEDDEEEELVAVIETKEIYEKPKAPTLITKSMSELGLPRPSVAARTRLPVPRTEFKVNEIRKRGYCDVRSVYGACSKTV